MAETRVPAPKYQDWTNYETWLVALWLDNDRGSYEEWRERARTLLASKSEEEVWTDEEWRRFTLADELKDSFDEAKPELDGFWSDLLGSALAEVDWVGISKHILDREES